MHSWGLKGGGASRLLRGATGMNTTELIAQWTMSGARRDADGRFRVLGEKRAKPEPKPPAGSFLMRGADGSWQPLRREEKKH
jgi:hypothetical protein